MSSPPLKLPEILRSTAVRMPIGPFAVSRFRSTGVENFPMVFFRKQVPTGPQFPLVIRYPSSRPTDEVDKPCLPSENQDPEEPSFSNLHNRQSFSDLLSPLSGKKMLTFAKCILR